MKYIVIDACLNGSGIRDKYNGGYLFPKDLNLSTKLINELNEWLLRYEEECFNGFVNNDIICELDKLGIEIAKKIKNEMSNIKIEYFSSAKMTSELIV